MTLTDFQLAQRHRYVTEHGREPAPGVTSIDIIEKPALKWAAAEVAAKRSLEVTLEEIRAYRDECITKKKLIKGFDGSQVPASQATIDELRVHLLRGEFDRQWRAKADLGTRVHSQMVQWSQGISISQRPDEEPYMTAGAAFLEECAPTFLYLEQVVVHPAPRGDKTLEYGGRFDFIAQIDGRTLLCDYKTTEYRDILSNALQASAYCNASGIANYEPDGSLGELTPLPKLDGALTVYLNPKGYELVNPFEHISMEEAFDTFLSLRAVVSTVKKVERITKELSKNE